MYDILNYNRWEQYDIWHKHTNGIKIPTFEKELYMYIPFYIFTFKSSFEIIEKDKDSLENLKKQYNNIVKRPNHWEAPEKV